MDVHEHPHMHFDFTFVLLLHRVYLETFTVTDLMQFGQINVASSDLFIWTVLIISSSPTKIYFAAHDILETNILKMSWVISTLRGITKAMQPLKD